MARFFHIKNFKLFYGSKTLILLHVLDFFLPLGRFALGDIYPPLALSVTFGGVMWQRVQKRRTIMLS